MGLLSTIGAASGRAFGLTRVGAAIRDAYFNLTTLLLPGNGTNGAQNNTFLDSSTNNFTITRNGNTTQGTFSPFSQTGWSNYFDGTNDFLQKTSPSSALYDWTSTNWTLEFWIYANAFGQGANAESNVFGNATDGGATSYWTFGTISTGAVKWYYYNGGSVQITTTTTLSTGRWYHLAFVNNSNNLTIYIDGVSSATGTKSGTPQFSSGTPITLGKISSSFNGYISNLRITQSAVYTSNFTPSTTPLTAISGTQLLMCQSNMFLDNSTNAVVFTPNGDVSVQAFSPFAPTAAYDATVVGGSGYFDGTGDSLTMASSSAFAVGTVFTIECWIYPLTSGTSAGQPLFVNGTSAEIQFGYQGATSWGIAANNIVWRLTSSTMPAVNAWNHLVVVRSGLGTNQTSLFLNGVRVANGTVTDTFTSAGTGNIGLYGSGAYTGYVSSLRLVKGTAVYDPTLTTLTVPTAPLTAITNTQLLTNFTNAGITDATAKNVLETVGNAQISTTQSKFGGSSMYFDGTGDYLTFPSSQNWRFGTGDFTIEFWFNASSIPQYAGIIDARNPDTSHVGWNVLFYDYKISFGTAAVIYIAGVTTLSTGTWYHYALTRSGNTFKQFLNGTQEGTTYTGSSTQNFTNAILQIGSGASGAYTGYLDDVRITRGYARYTSNFTPPTAALPLQ